MPVFFVILLVLLNVSPVCGFDLPVSKISDDSLVRLKIKDSWMIETPVRVLSQYTRRETLESGERVEIRTTEGREEFMVHISRELTRGTDAVNRIGTGQFPGWIQGSWMLTRRKDTGAGIQVKIFLRSDQQTFIQFHPFGSDKCLMDAVVYGGFIAHSIPVAVPFERLYTMPLNDILRLVENKFPMRYFEPDISNYKDTRTFIEQVRSKLTGLRFVDDGAINEDGKFVFIETLQPQPSNLQGFNCSGFTKWLIDGILRPVTGARLSIPPLKAPFGKRGSSFTAKWEKERDVFFGLDWIRNLAAVANGTLRTSSHRSLDEFEIRSENFAYVLVNEKRSFVVHSYPSFLSEAGYGIEGLHPLLYTLAIDEPFSFYLAAVSKEFDNPSSPSGTPRLRQYYHVAALIPYFDENGFFKIVVFESAAETSFTAFRNRYPKQHVNLVKIPISPTFDP
jgi:hypothetical protein